MADFPYTSVQKAALTSSRWQSYSMCNPPIAQYTIYRQSPESLLHNYSNSSQRELSEVQTCIIWNEWLKRRRMAQVNSFPRHALSVTHIAPLKAFDSFYITCHCLNLFHPEARLSQQLSSVRSGRLRAEEICWPRPYNSEWSFLQSSF